MERLFNVTSTIVRWTCLVLLLSLTIIVFAKVLFRYLFNSPLVWSDEVIMLALLALTYFGAALAAESRAHINVEIAENIFKRWNENALKLYYLICDIIMVLLLFLVIYFAVSISIYSKNQETDILLLSYFWVYILMPIGLLFMILLITKRIYEDWFSAGKADNAGLLKGLQK